MKSITKKHFMIFIAVISAAGLALRFLGFPFESSDYRQCLSSWSAQLSTGSITALSEYRGDYNYPYITILYFLTYLPVSPLYSIKMVSVLFDFLEAGLVASTVMYAVTDENRYKAGLLGYAMIFCNPLAIMNSSWLAQCESVWTALALLAFYFVIVREKPAFGMFAFGMALAFKLQAVFILPILLIFFFHKKKYSFLHLLWIPVGVEVLCIPAIIGGCGWDSAINQYLHLLGEYPYMFYYYPNIWTFFQTAPYYVFGTIAVVFTFIVLLLFAVLFVKSGRRHTLQQYVEYAAWTAMTCTMLLPCMHERYNYVAEMLLPISALYNRKLRIPALFLVLNSVQCIGQQFMGWPKLHWFILAGINILIYFYFSAQCLGGLYADYKEKEKAAC